MTYCVSTLKFKMFLLFKRFSLFSQKYQSVPSVQVVITPTTPELQRLFQGFLLFSKGGLFAKYLFLANKVILTMHEVLKFSYTMLEYLKIKIKKFNSATKLFDFLRSIVNVAI